MPAFLAGEFYAGRTLGRRDPIRRAAFSASRLDAGIALLNDNGLALHGLTDQTLGLFAHRLLRHPLLPAMENALNAALYTPSASCDQPCCEKTGSEAASLPHVKIRFQQLL